VSLNCKLLFYKFKLYTILKRLKTDGEQKNKKYQLYSQGSAVNDYICKQTVNDLIFFTE